MGLGEPVDRQISAWDEMFLPVRMMDRLRTMRVQGAGGTQPLVNNERILVQAARPPEDLVVWRGISGYFMVALMGLLVGAGLWMTRWKKGKRAGLLTLAMIWNLLAGLAGTLLFGLWAFTDHLYSYHNENLFQLNPLSLILAALMMRVVWRSRGSVSTGGGGRHPRRTIQLAALVAAISVSGFLLQVLPGLEQVNGHIIALVMPLHLGVAALLFSLREPHHLTTQSSMRLAA